MHGLTIIIIITIIIINVTSVIMLFRKTYISVVASCLAPCILLLLPASGLWGSLGWDVITQTCTILAPGECRLTMTEMMMMMTLTTTRATQTCSEYTWKNGER